jgi:DNA-binding CsgD family transcriptional regulator
MSDASSATQVDESTASEDGARGNHCATWPATNTRQISPKHETAKLPDLIDEIYGAALEPALWNDVIAGINEFIGDAANVVLEQSNLSCAVLLTVLSEPSVIDDEMQQRIALIVPHIHRALHIRKAIDLKQSEAATFVDTLNGLSVGVFLVDAKRRIIHANNAGHDMLHAEDFLRSVRGQLVARNVQADQILGDVLADNCGGAIDAKDIALPLTAHDGKHYVAHVLPLSSAARTGTGVAYEAVAALFVRKVGLHSPCGELIAGAFELTPAELRVLLTIVQTGGVWATSEALGIAESTVKTHLHHIFTKTGARRQADLVKLVAGFSNPLVG